jgi:YidC/Oxa1 family membrane protein insertase
MKFQDVLVPLVFTVLMVWGLQYFVINKHLPSTTGEIKSGQSFTAPLSDQVIKPLRTEINFIDQQSTPKVVTEIETTGALYKFSTDGGTLEQLTYKRLPQGHQSPLTMTIMPPVLEREDYSFLVGLNDATPFYYQLVDKQESPETVKVVYQASTPQAMIRKEFIVFKDTYKLDLIVTVAPLATLSEPLQARLFLPAPFMSDAHLKDTVSAILYNENNKLQKIKPADVKQQLWVAPTFFGAENRYFVNSLLEDPDHFVQRGYYKITNVSPLTAVIESVPVHAKTSWKLSFYCGPKEAHQMALVDSRLEQTLDYGWLGGIAKILRSALDYLFKYVKNYGWAIVVLTILMKIIMLPITWRAEQGGKAAAKQAEFQKKLQYLEQKYKHDRETLAREQLKLYKKFGTSSAGGCLLPLLQAPIFIGLNRVITNSIEFYQAPFVGWITDLSAPDAYYLLPLLSAVGLGMQTASSGDVRKRLVSLLIAAMVAGIFAGFPAGVTLYLAVSSLLGVLQAKIQQAYKL